MAFLVDDVFVTYRPFPTVKVFHRVEIPLSNGKVLSFAGGAFVLGALFVSWLTFFVTVFVIRA